MNQVKQHTINNVYQWLSVFSIDVVIGVVACGFLAVKLLDVHPSIFWWIILPLTVWLIYTLDHIVDGRKVGKNALTKRHYFHFIFAKPLLAISLLILIGNAVLALFFLERNIFVAGAILGFLVFTYFMLIKFSKETSVFRYQKELSIATLFSAGIWIGPLVLAGFTIEISQWLLIGAFFLTALNNLVIFSIFEKELDEAQNFKSLARVINNKTLRTILYISLTFVTIVCFSSVLLSIEGSIYIKLAGFIIMLMNFVLLMISSMPKVFKKNELFRHIGDGVFMFPFLILFGGLI